VVAAAVVGGGAISGLGSLIGGSTASSGAQQAAQTEAAAQQAAVAAQQQDFQITQGNLEPFVGYGMEGITDLLTEMNTPGFGGTGAGGGPLGAIPNITDPSQLPGYQFTLTQGENAVKNAASAQGEGGNSGPLWKSLESFATGLASSSYGQFLQNYWTNQNNRYNMLYNQVLTGQNSAANVGQAATATGGNQGQAITSTAAAQAQAQQNAANLTGSSITGAGSSLGNSLTSSLLLSNAFGNTGSTITPTDTQLSEGVQAMYPGVANP
jgi:hypothetical protein